MKIEEFRALSEAERVTLINERLAKLKGEGKGTKEFKGDSLEFSYATAIKEMESLGYARNGNSFEKEIKLSEYDIIKLKNLVYGYDFMMKQLQEKPEVNKRPDDQATTTSVRMYNKVWKRWQSFADEWSIYNSIDLMASALESYMDKFEHPDYDTLVDQGKIKEK
jgi:UTP-glucose-1-phosphate uridylyltransferase